MKKNILFTILAFLFIFTSCKLDSGYNDTIPSIFFGSQAKLNSDSLLYLKSTSQYNVAGIDSIHVGDTVVIKVGMNAYFNQLSEFDFQVNDTSAVKTILSDSVKMLFKSMNENSKKYIFDDNYSYVIMPLKLVALKESDSIMYTFGVYSNVTKVSNYNDIGLKTKIKPVRN